ncbi:MAG: hypothetical protein GC180_04485 [Bacteroidetes bacterium]|nr:hypothetical protein [Bacteroidota bacterium]
MLRPFNRIRFWVWMAVFLLASCSQITLKQAQLNEALYTGNVQQAYDIMNNHVDRWKKNRNALLYYWNKGTFAWMLGKYDESSKLFMASDYFLEDMYKNYANMAASLFINDKIRQYTGEDHERILFQYYQILNFMRLGNLENALVQARRLQLELNRLDDRYKDQKGNKNTRYQEDAFAYILIGLVYEAAHDESNALVAYRNAYRIYSESYKSNFNTEIPRQLLKDLMRLAYRNGYDEYLNQIEKETGVSFNKSWLRDEGNTVVFWNNGLSPVKQEVAVNFTIVRNGNTGWVTFYNSNYGLSIPVYVGNENTQQGSAFNQLQFIRATFPKYFNRGSRYFQGSLMADSLAHPLELVENVTAIAQKEMHDRFLKEIGKTLLRLALKKVSEAQMRKENPEAGAVVGLVNFVTEQADTRSWESLPDQISYTRLSLPPGEHEVSLRTYSSQDTLSNSMRIKVPQRGMVFQGFHTLQPQLAIN